MENMLLYNQTQDYFSPRANYQKTPSEEMEREYEEKILQLSTSTRDYSTSRWELDRKYQLILAEEEVNRLLRYAIETVEVINKIKLYQKFPMVRLDFWDPRDIPYIYQECVELYSKLTGEKKEDMTEFSLNQVSVMQGMVEKTYYSIAEVKYCFICLEKILKRLEVLKKVREKIKSLDSSVSLIFENEIHPITVERIEELKTRSKKMIEEYSDIYSKIENSYKEEQFWKNWEKIKEMDNNIVIFSVDEEPDLSLFFTHQIPKMGKRNRSFVVNIEDKETIQSFLKEMPCSPKYYMFSSDVF